jgi:hypothetical protein
VAASACAAVVLVGCGSGGDDHASGTAATTTAAAPASGTTTGETTTTASPSTTVDEATAGDWCPLTAEQVSAVVRHAVVEGQPCTWSDPGLTSAVLEVHVSGTDAAHLAGSTETVDGVADAAAFDASDALVFEHHGGHWVVQIIDIGGASDVVAKDAEIELAGLVVDGIG